MSEYCERNELKMAEQGIKGELDRLKLEDHIPLRTPLRVLLEASSYCNFRCSFCPHGNSEAERLMPRSIISTALAKKCIRDLTAFRDKVKTLAFVSFGEPLVNKALPDIVKMAVECEVAEKYEITTNASLLTEALSERLISAGLSLINISIYGLNDSKYKEFSDAEVSFDEIVRSIAYLHSISGNAQVVVKISDAVCDTETEQAEFYSIFSSVCDKICIEHAVPLWYDLHEGEISALDIYGNHVAHKEVCPVPFFTMSINASGVVSPCCNDWKNMLTMGEANVESLESIWSGTAFRDLQRRLLSGGTSSLYPCSNCKYHEMVAIDNIDPFRSELLERLTT